MAIRGAAQSGETLRWYRYAQGETARQSTFTQGVRPNKGRPQKTMKIKTEPAVYTPAQVADMLQLHPVSLRRMLRAGRIPGVIQIGSNWRFPKAVVDRILNSGIGGATR
jgi:excisionase family DNA binding protein